MRYSCGADRALAILEVGDSLHRACETLLAASGWPAMAVNAIGAVDGLELAYYSLAEKRYLTQELAGIWELVSLQGNVCFRDGAPFAHLHVLIGDPQLNARTGHLMRAQSAITVELVAFRLDVEVVRGAVDERSGLRHMTLEGCRVALDPTR